MRLVLGLLTVVILGGTASAIDPATERHRGDLVIRARAILNKYCAECHKPGGKAFDILDRSILTGKHPVPFVNAEKGGRSQIIEFIEDGSMPPAGRKHPELAELNALKDWIAHGAPKYPKAFDDAYALNEAADDLAKQKPANHFRYVSLAHRIKDGDPFTSLKSEQERLQAALDASTTKDHLVALQPVDAAGVVFRIDIEKLGWNTTGYFWEIDLNGSPASAHDLTAFDLILLENPYPVEPSERFEKAFGRRKYVQQSAVLRGDWLADVLAPNAPLSADLKSMVELSGPGEKACGPKIRTFQKPAKNGVPPPGVPLTSWYEPDRFEPFKLDVTMNGAKPPFNVQVGEGYTMDVVSDRDAQFILLNVLSDGTVKVLQPGGGNVLKAGESRKLETVSRTPFKIGSIPGGEDKATEYFVVIAAPTGVPLPTLVRTEHNTIGCQKGTGQIWRILFDDDKKFDPSKAVRKIVPIHVTKKK